MKVQFYTVDYNFIYFFFMEKRALCLETIRVAVLYLLYLYLKTIKETVLLAMRVQRYKADFNLNYPLHKNESFMFRNY